MSTALQMPGWGNSFTQPIANRIEMLSTGVRLPVAVKVFGSKLDEIQRVSQEIAGVLRGVRGAADVFPDQIIGKGYVEIKIDRKKAARYGISVGDIQDVVEVAMGGQPADDDRRGPRALPGPRPLRPRLPRRRRVAQAHPRLGPSDEWRHGRRWLIGGMGGMASMGSLDARRLDETGQAAPDPPGRAGRRSGWSRGRR